MKSHARGSAILELSLAAAFWGFGFIAAVWALRGMGPLAATGWRFALAAIVGVGIMLARPGLRKSFSWEQFRLAAIPGLLISFTLVTQTWGLKYTTATKSGFITTLYVLIVPLLEGVLLKRKVPRLHFLFVAFALLGVALICDLPRELSGGGAFNAESPAAQRLNFGDALTLLCSVAASLHILYFGYIYKRIGSSFAFNNYQSIWAGVIPLALSFVLEPWPRLSFDNSSLQGLLMLAFGSTLIAFALQVRAQKDIAPSLASLLFLLESPFATVFAIYFLAETMHTAQWAGAGLIMIAAILSTAYAKEVDEETLR